MTTATWIREFVQSHPDYRHDSVISDSIAYDLMIACKQIGEGERPCPELYGSAKITRYAPPLLPCLLLPSLTTIPPSASAQRMPMVSYWIAKS
jgi:hypothetical protein